MEASAKLTELCEGLRAQIADKSKKRVRERAAYLLQLSAIALAAAITVLLGFEGLGAASATAKNVALLFGAIITVLNASEAFYDHRSRWIGHTVGWVQLLQHKNDVDYYVAGREPAEIDLKDVDDFAARFRTILEDDMEGWLRSRETTGVV